MGHVIAGSGIGRDLALFGAVVLNHMGIFTPAHQVGSQHIGMNPDHLSTQLQTKPTKETFGRTSREATESNRDRLWQ
ncbi:MAG TPA: hypothetical protein DCP92_02755 [Nitrospiraceae bacterium]|jgi:hypothetical protein|nr:hypothetical protein [Nitrospiraceae bacterium]